MERIGLGQAKSSISAGRPLILGGVEIPSEYGLVGNRDGDIICLSIIDSLLGSANFGGINDMFPADAMEFAHLQSFELLTAAFVRLAGEGYRVSNIDINLSIPIDISNFFPEINSKLAVILETNRINIKLLPVDNEISATALALVDQNLFTKRNRDVLARNNPNGF